MSEVNGGGGPPQAPPPLPAPAEQVVLASWGRRAGAWLIDYFIWAIPGFALAIPMMVHMFHYFETHPGAPPPGVQPDVELIFGSGFALYQGVGILLTLGQIAYQIVLNGHPRGQTVGKMAFGIQVRNASNMDTLGYGRSTARWLVGYALLLACIVPGIVDLLFPLWDDKRQTIHDKAAGSLVIRLQRI